MKSVNVPLGSMFKRYLLAFLVFMGMSVNAYALVITESDLAGKVIYDSYAQSDGSTEYGMVTITSPTSLSRHQETYDASGTKIAMSSVDVNYVVNASGQMVIDTGFDDLYFTLDDINTTTGLTVWQLTEEMDFNKTGVIDMSGAAVWHFDKPTSFPADFGLDTNVSTEPLPTDGSMPGTLTVWQMTLSSVGTVANAMYDFATMSFMDDVNSTYTVDANNTISFVNEDNSTAEVLYDSTANIGGFDYHTFCVSEKNEYFKVSFVSGDATTVSTVLSDPNFDMTSLHTPLTMDEYSACNALPVNTLYDIPLNMIEMSYDTYQDDSANYPYQVIGTVTLPELPSDVFVSMNAMPVAGTDWGYAHITTAEGNNSYSLGLNDGQYVLSLGISKPTGYEEYVYDANTTAWISSQGLEYVAVDELGNIVPPELQDPNVYYNYVPNVTPINTLDFNSSSQLQVNMDLTTIYANQYTVNGNIIVPSDFTPTDYCTDGNTNVLEICEWNQGGVSGYNMWQGRNGISIELTDAQTGAYVGYSQVSGIAVNDDNTTKTYEFSASVTNEGNYTIRLNKDSFDPATLQTNWESFYFNPQTSSLIDSMTVQYVETNTTDGYTMWVPDTNQTGIIEVTEDVNGSRAVSFGDINFADFAATQIKLNGTVSFTNADFVQVELINTQNGYSFGWSEISNSGDDFNITLPAGEGQYILRLSKASAHSWESYYYDVNNAKFVMDNVNWIETSNGNWMPDVNQTGSIVISDTNADGSVTQDEIQSLSIDFAALDGQFYTLSGLVTVPDTFVAGEVIDANGNYVGWNNINFEVMDKITGDYIGWFEIDRDSNVTTNSETTYGYSVKLANAGEYTVRVRYEDQVNNKYEGYFIDFNNSALVNEMKVPFIESNVTNDMGYTNWIPDFDSALVLTDANKSQTFNVDFVALDASMYKLTGSITVPTDFIPNNDWENRKMIRVEAIDANTGAWLGDGPISTIANANGTYDYTITLLDAASGSDIIIKIVKEEQSATDFSWEAYYVKVDGNVTSFVAEETVEWGESNTTDASGYTMWLPNKDQTGFITLDATMTVNLDIDYETLTTAYDANKLSFSGTIITSQAVSLGWNDNRYNSIRLEAIDAVTGEWITSKDVDYTSTTTDTFNFDLEFAQAGSYIVKVVLELDGNWEEYYINFGADHAALGSDLNADKLVSGNRVEWKESNTTAIWGGKNWMPDPDQSGYINLNSKVDAYAVDFLALEGSISRLSGIVTVESGFQTGDIYDVNGNWIGYNNIRVEAISKSTGDWIASTDLVNKTAATDEYAYELKIGDTTDVGNEFIIRIVKESSSDGNWDYDEYYVDYDNTNLVVTSLVNGKRVQWVEAEVTNQFGYKNWLPNPNDTGWVVVNGVAPDNVNVDFTTLGSSDITISGAITFKSDFDLSTSLNEARVSAIDADTGMWISDTSVDNNGSYELNLDVAGNYIVQISYSHNDFSDWQNSWWKSKYLDFTDNSGTHTVKSDNEVQWVEVVVAGQEWNSWVPNVNSINVTANITGLDIDVSTTSGGNINGVISGLPAGVNNPYVYVVNPLTYASSWIDLKDNQDGNYTFNAEEVTAGDYTVEFGYEINGKYHHYFIKDDNNDITDGVSAVDGQEVSWSDLGNGQWGPSAADTTYVNIANGADTNLSISLVVPTYNAVTVTLNGTLDNKYASADINVPGKSFGRWQETTTVGTSATFTFDDVKDGSAYILNFWYDNNSYTCDGAACDALVKNAMWIAFDANDVQVCPTLPNNDWDCNWDNSMDWSWKPDVTPVTVSGDTAITATLPEELVVTGSLSLGAEFAGKDAYVSIFQHNGNDWNWGQFTLGANGDVNSSMRVAGGTDYRIELWVDGLGGYVYTTAGWITQNSSWSEDNVTHMWEPNAATLIDINADLDLGLVDVGSDLETVTIVLENLDVDSNNNVVEDIWVSFESLTNGWYGEGNANWDNYPVTYESNITIKLPAGTDYRLAAFPMNHKGGYASNGNGTADDQITQSTKLSWDEQDYVTVNSGSATTITITLPTANEVGEINGTVTCDDTNASADCSGWIDAWSGTDGKGVMVAGDGTYEIKGLEAGTYEVNYWGNTGIALRASADVVADAVTTLDVAKVATEMITIDGTVTSGTAALSEIYVVLIETDGVNYEVINTAEIDGAGYYIFPEMQKTPSGKALVVAAATRTVQADYSTAVVFDDAIEVFDAAGTVGMPTLSIDNFAGGLTATAN